MPIEGKAIEAARTIAVPGGHEPVVVIGDLSCFEDVQRIASGVGNHDPNRCAGQ